jgi:hypothetical protein
MVTVTIMMSWSLLASVTIRVLGLLGATVGV